MNLPLLLRKVEALALGVETLRAAALDRHDALIDLVVAVEVYRASQDPEARAAAVRGLDAAMARATAVLCSLSAGGTGSTRPGVPGKGTPTTTGTPSGVEPVAPATFEPKAVSQADGADEPLTCGDADEFDQERQHTVAALGEPGQGSRGGEAPFPRSAGAAGDLTEREAHLDLAIAAALYVGTYEAQERARALWRLRRAIATSMRILNPPDPPRAFYAGSTLRDPMGREGYTTSCPPDPDRLVGGDGRFFEIEFEAAELARQAERC